MDDIDQELKKVQLQRERLALERELALKDATDTAKHVAGTIAGSVATPIKAAGNVFSRWWPTALILILVIGGGIGFLAWQKEKEHERQYAMYTEHLNRWQSGQREFIAQQCPEKQYACQESTKDSIDGYLDCRLKESSHNLCKVQAESAYRSQFPYPSAPSH